MINIMNFYEAGKARSGTALFPINGSSISIIFSTRHGNAVVDWGDGTTSNWNTLKNRDYIENSAGGNISHGYGANYNGNISIKFLQGLRDVYSFNTTDGAASQKINILDFGAFINQFPNLYSIRLYSYAYNVYADMGVIKGDLGNIPASVERYQIQSFEIKDNATDVWFNFSSLPVNSKLKFLDFSGEGGIGTRRKILGNLANLPVGCSFVKISRADNSSITYTAGKVWASSFDTLSIPLALTTTELDNLLIDMNNSITTKIGAGVIALVGYRSAVSDSAVASLQAKGFTVDVKVKELITDSSVIFRMDFQNNYNVWSNSLIDITSGNGVGSFGNLPTFALSGRKAGEYCAVFNGSQSIKTTTNLPVNSDKVTIAFWMKTTQTAGAIVGEMSPNTNSNNTFSWYINDAVANSVQFNSRNTGENKSVRTGANNGTWKHFVAVIDRSQNGANEILIYENGALVSFTKPASADNNGNFVNNILFIGQRAGSSAGFNGSLTKLKLYNYPLTAGEVSTLYNSEL